MAPAEPTADALQVLEEKIRRAAEVVSRLRKERDSAVAEAEQAEPLRLRVAELTREVETLRAEREMVRQRVGKLLEQLDALNAV